MLTEAGDDSRWDDEGGGKGSVCKECKSSADQGWREGFLSLCQQRGVLGKKEQGALCCAGTRADTQLPGSRWEEVRLHTEAWLGTPGRAQREQIRSTN